MKQFAMARRNLMLRLPQATFCGIAAMSTAMAQDGAASVPAASTSPMPNLWDLAIQGGWFMIPIAVASVVTITFTLERLVGLRSGRILPRRLIRSLRELMSEASLDPRRLWELCEFRPSPLANVLKAAVLKTGRPQAELEKAVEDAVARETDDMTRNLRPINVVASIAPLLGLLGTVQGMIMAFMVTSTTTSTGTAKAQELAHGIYTALVTTFAGLCVAVISVVLANFLEGRIERRLRQLEALFLDLLPQLERYEGRLRITESNSAAEPGIQVKSLRPASRAERTDSSASETASAPPAPTAGLAAAARQKASSKLVRPADDSRSQSGADILQDPEAPVDSIASSGSLRANFNR